MILAALALGAATLAPTCARDSNPAALLCTAVTLSDEQRYAEAAAAFEQAAAASPAADPRTARMLAAAGNMWIAAGQAGKAALALDRALAGTGLQAEQRGLALLDRARAAEAQSDLKSARRFATEAAASAGEDPFYWYFSAALAVREGALDRAKADIGRALSMAPTTAEFLFEAGFIANERGELAVARDYFTRALNADGGGKIGEAAKRALDALPKLPPALPAAKE